MRRTCTENAWKGTGDEKDLYGKCVEGDGIQGLVCEGAKRGRKTRKTCTGSAWKGDGKRERLARKVRENGMHERREGVARKVRNCKGRIRN